MSLREAPQEALTYAIDPDVMAPEFRELRDLWEAKRGSRPMPDRSEIDPFELRAHLPYLGLLDVLPGGADFRFRLIGTGIAQRFGRDSTGKTVSEAYAGADPELRQWMMAIYGNAVTTGRPILGHGSLRAVGKDFVVFEVLNLPFSGDDGTVGVIMSKARFEDPA